MNHLELLDVITEIAEDLYYDFQINEYTYSEDPRDVAWEKNMWISLMEGKIPLKVPDLRCERKIDYGVYPQAEMPFRPNGKRPSDGERNDMKWIIHRFRLEYNFYPACVQVDGLEYLNSKVAFQAAKCAKTEGRLIF